MFNQTNIFYLLEQKERLNRTSFIEDPLVKCPSLPVNPDDWSPSHVQEFIKVTDCSQYADVLKDEVCFL